MIDYLDGNITNILPDSLKHIPETRAMGYAISRMIEKILEHSHKASVYAVIDILPEEAVDLLAVELRSKYYGEILSLEENREIVKKTMLWHYKAGTIYTVQELVDFIFEDARAEEWFSYGTDPYLFRIQANMKNKGISMERFLQFLKSMYEVKNTRSHMESVIFNYNKEADVKAVAAAGIGCDLKVKAKVAEGIRAETRGSGVVAVKMEQGIKVVQMGEVPGNVYVFSDTGKKTNVLTADGVQVRII